MPLYSLATIREKLWDYTNSKVPYASATAAQKSAADWRINQCSERILGDGKYKNTLRRVVIPIYDGYITLPRELNSIIGLQMISENGCCCPTIIYSKFHEFAHPVGCGCSGGARSISETAQTFITPTAPFKLRVKSTVTSGTVTFYRGWDTDDEEYFDSVSLNIENGTTTTTREWNVMPQIQKSVTTVGVELYSVDSDSVETLIAVYAPYEEIPSYKKYKVPDWNGYFTNALVFGKLGYVPVTADYEIVIPSNFGALKMALKALRSEDTEEDDSADKDWSRCFEILDKEVIETDTDAEFPMFRVASQTGCEGIYQVV